MSKKKDRSASPSTPQQSNGVSRRSFLKGASLSAAGAALLDSGLLAAGQAAGPKVLGPDAAPMTLKINGKPHSVQLEPSTTLADALRDHLNLTGTKVVCDRGACSACTVYVDGTPVCSCMTLAADVASTGADITTIEGLAEGNALHPVQAAFIEHDASQCGFCTPGMVMSAAALLRKNPSPKLEDVKTAVSGNLCRCGTYPKVFEATLAAAGRGKVSA
jgi:aerobic-type carbon monoxide dehydrogenase small subunit (CoxS/CutS family)